jgi:hypothetical protein
LDFASSALRFDIEMREYAGAHLSSMVEPKPLLLPEISRKYCWP